MTSKYEIEALDSLDGISVAAWNTLAGDDPFLRHELFSALHGSGCASPETGWRPRFLALREEGVLRGALPLYLKDHSYGEYVFDWAWADAHRRCGYAYYPKLLSAVPFSPVTGRRLLADTAEHRRMLIGAALKMAVESGVSSFHCLFPGDGEAAEWKGAGLALRQGVQFHWRNRPDGGYADFDEFLGTLERDKRRKIRQERRRLQAEGIRFQWLSGHDAQPDHWRFFAGCYDKTYFDHHASPYLSLDFFLRLGRHMPENVLLILALREGRPIAAALNLHNDRTLYGRYWGTMAFVPGLHFETCYYQAIEFCIARGLDLFEGGAQGEHKLARGLLPARTWSAHWLAHPEFAAAVGHHVRHEAQGVDRYLDTLNARSPFRKEAGSG